MLIIKIYCQLDEFYKLFEEQIKTLPKSNKGRKSKLTIPEIATILVLFHLSGYSNFKRFYKDYALIHLKSYFPDLVSYNRFKVFKGLAKRGKDSVGWFYGFKLHLIVNEKGEILSFDLTKGNVDDRKPLYKMIKDIKGKVLKLFGDRGYISEELSNIFLSENILILKAIYYLAW